MRGLRAQRGMTLVELMIATGVAAVLSTAALQLFAMQARFGRVTALQNELNDRSRLVRELLTHDILRAGYYWSHEGQNANGFATGGFGSAGMGSTLTNPATTWSAYPFAGKNHTDQADMLVMLVPSAEVLAGNADPSDPAYACKEGAVIKTVSPDFAHVPGATFAGWLDQGLVIGAGSGIVMLTTLSNTSNLTTSQRKIYLNGLAAGQCAAIGTVVDTPLPRRFSVYPVEAVAWVLNGTDLRRCRVRYGGDGPLQWDTDSTCGDNFTIMRDVEDIQFRYRYSRSTADINYNPLSFDDCYSDNPDVLNHDTDATVYANLKNNSGAACGGQAVNTEYRKRIAEEDPGSPGTMIAGIRFTGIEVGLVLRSARIDPRFNNRGHSFKLFDHDPGFANDNYRRVKSEFRVVTPNAFVF